MNGSDAAGISCTKLYVSLGAQKENIYMLNRKGMIRADRPDLGGTKAEFATNRHISTLADAVKNADVFIGLSSADILSAEVLKTMTSILLIVFDFLGLKLKICTTIYT